MAVSIKCIFFVVLLLCPSLLNAVVAPTDNTGHNFAMNQAYGLYDLLFILVMFVIMFGAAYAVFRGKLKAGTIGVVVFAFMLFMRGFIFQDIASGGFGGGDTSSLNAFSVTETVSVYGVDPASPVYDQLNRTNYAVVGGYINVGMVLLSKLSHGILAMGLVALLLGLAVIITAFRAWHSQSYKPLIWFAIKLGFIAVFGFLPLVRISSIAGSQSGITEVFKTITEDFKTDGQVPLLPVAIMNGSTNIAEKIGGIIKVDEQTPDLLILNASKSAKLSAENYRLYTSFSDNCFVSVRNIMKMNSTEDSSYIAYLAERTADIRLPLYSNAARNNQHALSRASEKLFQDIDYDGYVVNDKSDIDPGGLDSQTFINAMAGRFNGRIMAHRLAEQGEMHMSPYDGHVLKRLSTINVQKIRSNNTKGIALEALTATAFGLTEFKILDSNLSGDYILPKPFSASSNSDLLYKRTVNDDYAARRYCALLHPSDEEFLEDKGRKRQFNISATATFSDVPETYTENFGDSNPHLVHVIPVDMQQYVRNQIYKDYTIERCKEAAKNPETSNIAWGCMINGLWDSKYVGITKHLTAQAMQVRFDTRWREELWNHTKEPSAGLRNRTRYKTSEPDTELANASGHVAYFTDHLMIAPGIQKQIGLNHSLQSEAADYATPAWFDNVTGLVDGVFTWTFAGVFAFIAGLMSKIALIMYPHVLGLAFLFLLLSWPFYALRAMFDGLGFAILEWGKAMFWICLWPIFITLGIALMNSSGIFRMNAFYLGGGDDVSGSILQIFGAMLIFMAPAFASSFITYSFGGLQSVVGSISGTANKLAGASALIMGSLIAVAASAGGGILGGVFGALAKGTSDVGNNLTNSGSNNIPDKTGDDKGTSPSIEHDGPGRIPANDNAKQRIMDGMRRGADVGRSVGGNVTNVIRGSVETADAMGMDGARTGGFAGESMGQGAADTAHLGMHAGINMADAALESSAAGSNLKVGNRHLQQAQSALKSGNKSGFHSHSANAAVAFETASNQFALRGNDTAALDAGTLAHQQYVAAGDSRGAEHSARQNMSLAHTAMMNSPNSRMIAGKSNAVIGGMQSFLGDQKMTLAAEAKGTGNKGLAKHLESEAKGIYGESYNRFGTANENTLAQASVLNKRFASGPALSADIANFTSLGEASLQNASAQDRIGTIIDKPSDNADSMLNAFRKISEDSNDPNVQGAFKKFNP